MTGKFWIGFVILLFSLASTFALPQSYEATSVSRIVGDSPLEMRQQLTRSDLIFNSAGFTDISSPLTLQSPISYILISKGARIIESKGLTLADVAPKLFSPSVKAKFFRDLGKISEIQSDNYAKKFLDLHDIQGIENLAKNVVTDQDGYKFEVDVAIGLKNELQEVSKQLKPVIGIDGEIDGVLKSGDVYDAKYDWGLLKHTDNKWDKKIDDYAGQISRAKQFLAATGNPNKQVIFIFNTDLSKDMDDFLKLHGVQVRKLENGKLVNPQVIP